MAERKRQRKLSGYTCCYFNNFICFISLYALVSSLFVFHFTFLMQKNQETGRGGPLTAGGPCHGTIGTMGNPALGSAVGLQSARVKNMLATETTQHFHPYKKRKEKEGVEKVSNLRSYRQPLPTI